MRRVLAILAVFPQPGEAEIRRRLEEVYHRPEFSPEDSWDLGRWVLRIIRWLAGLRTSDPALYWTILVTCVLLLIALLAHIVWTVLRVLSAGDPARRAAEAADARARLSQAFRQEAEQCAARGDFTEAIRHLFLSLVYRFDESGRVSFRRAYTNREYLHLFDDRPRERDALAVFVDILDDHWYGQHPTERARYEDCLALYEGLT